MLPTPGAAAYQVRLVIVKLPQFSSVLFIAKNNSFNRRTYLVIPIIFIDIYTGKRGYLKKIELYSFFDSGYFNNLVCNTQGYFVCSAKEIFQMSRENKEILLMNSAATKNIGRSWVPFQTKESLQCITHSLRKAKCNLVFTQPCFPSRYNEMLGKDKLSVYPSYVLLDCNTLLVYPY